MSGLVIERELLARAKRERAGLRVVWDQALDLIPARRQARLAIELAKVKPVLIQKNGTRVPCEQPFRLNRKERQQLAARMLGEGASRNEVLATVEISPQTLLKVMRGISPNGHRKPHSNAGENAVSGHPAGMGRVDEEGNPIPDFNRFGDPVPDYLPRDRRGPPIIDVTGGGPDAWGCFQALMADPDEPPRMTKAESERNRPDWHSWVYGAAKNPIHKRPGDEQGAGKDHPHRTPGGTGSDRRTSLLLRPRLWRVRPQHEALVVLRLRPRHLLGAT